MASFKHPSTLARKAGPDGARTLLQEPGIAARYEAARQCTLCKIAGDDRPGSSCDGPLGEVECGASAPLYLQTLDAYLATPDGQAFVRKYVAR